MKQALHNNVCTVHNNPPKVSSHGSERRIVDGERGGRSKKICKKELEKRNKKFCGIQEGDKTRPAKKGRPNEVIIIRPNFLRRKGTHLANDKTWLRKWIRLKSVVDPKKGEQRTKVQFF